MTVYTFSTLTNGQHIAFHPDVDQLSFDSNSFVAIGVTLAPTGSGLNVSYGTKTVSLDNVTLGDLWDKSFAFADGGRLLVGAATFSDYRDAYGRTYNLVAATARNQVWGLGGADTVRGSAKSDNLIGNEALTPIQHVSRDGSAGSLLASYRPTVSFDGKKVAFEGDWTGFRTAGNEGIIVKNIGTGRITNEHVNADGVFGNSGAGSPVLSADGRYVAYSSASSNLVPGDDSGALYDIYLAGTTGNRILRVSTGTGGTLAADGRSVNPDISATGRYVVFESDTSNFASGGSTAQTDIFLKDVNTGVTTRLSTSTDGTDGNGDSLHARVSADGKVVVFQSAASNLVTGDTNGYDDIFLWTAAGGLRNITKDLAAVSSPNNGVFNPDVAVRDNGDVIVTFETGRNLVAADDHNSTDIYAYNVTKGTIQLVSAKADGTGVGVSSYDASISDDGRWVVFTSGSDSLVADDNNGYADVFVKDLVTGEIALVSRNAKGVVGNQASGHAAISSGGDFIVFESGASNLASTDANGGTSDVFRVSNPLLKDTLIGGDGNDFYVLDRADIVIEAANGGIDVVNASFSYTLPDNVEILRLTGTGAIAGTGNTLDNTIHGNDAANRLSGGAGDDALYGNGGVDILKGGAGADRLFGGDGADTLYGGAGSDVLNGGGGADRLVFDSASGVETVVGFTSHTDQIAISASAFALGNGDQILNNPVASNGPGGFTASNEVVVFSPGLTTLTTETVAGAIDHADAAIATGTELLFAINAGRDSQIYLFTSADGDAHVSASELTLVAKFLSSGQMAADDFLIVA